MPRSSAIAITSSSRLARTLVETGVSQGELARRTGLSRQTVYQAYRGEPISLATAVRIARALGRRLADVSVEAAAELDGLADVG